MIVDFSNLILFFVWYFVTVLFLAVAYVKKKSILACIPVFYFLIILGISAGNPEQFENLLVHRIFNFIGLRHFTGIVYCDKRN